ncbi:MAG: lysophospholipid acyltransferase family protein [Patescibacteria group bacterium]
MSHLWTLFFPLRAYIRSISGRHFIPGGPCIIASNHEGPLDSACIMLALKQDIRYVAARHLLRAPGLIGWYYRRMLFSAGRAIPTGGRCIETCRASLASGQTIGIFPEGDIHPALRQPRIHTGAVVLSRLAQLPILPIHIKNSGRVWPIYPLWKVAAWRFHCIDISIGQPIPPPPSGHKYTHGEYQASSDKLMGTVFSL